MKLLAGLFLCFLAMFPIGVVRTKAKIDARWRDEITPMASYCEVAGKWKYLAASYKAGCQFAIWMNEES